jgi:hypothetical protein
MTKKKVSAWIEPELLKSLKYHSSMNLVSGSSVIEEALTQYFKRLEKQSKKETAA